MVPCQFLEPIAPTEMLFYCWMFMLFAVWAFMWSWLPKILETPTDQHIKAEELYVSIFDYRQTQHFPLNQHQHQFQSIPVQSF